MSNRTQRSKTHEIKDRGDNRLRKCEETDRNDLAWILSDVRCDVPRMCMERESSRRRDVVLGELNERSCRVGNGVDARSEMCCDLVQPVKHLGVHHSIVDPDQVIPRKGV